MRLYKTSNVINVAPKSHLITRRSTTSRLFTRTQHTHVLSKQQQPYNNFTLSSHLKSQTLLSQRCFSTTTRNRKQYPPPPPPPPYPPFPNNNNPNHMPPPPPPISSPQQPQPQPQHQSQPYPPTSMVQSPGSMGNDFGSGRDGVPGRGSSSSSSRRSTLLWLLLLAALIEYLEGNQNATEDAILLLRLISTPVFARTLLPELGNIEQTLAKLTQEPSIVEFCGLKDEESVEIKDLGMHLHFRHHIGSVLQSDSGWGYKLLVNDSYLNMSVHYGIESDGKTIGMMTIFGTHYRGRFFPINGYISRRDRKDGKITAMPIFKSPNLPVDSPTAFGWIQKRADPNILPKDKYLRSWADKADKMDWKEHSKNKTVM